MIDRQGLHEFCGIPESGSFAEHHRQWVFDALRNGPGARESHWTESIAIGSGNFVEEIKAKLGVMAAGRKIRQQGSEHYILKEESAPYNDVFDTENETLRYGNAYFWDHQ